MTNNFPHECTDVHQLPKVFCVLNGTPHQTTAQRFAQKFLASGVPYRDNWFVFTRAMTTYACKDTTYTEVLINAELDLEAEWEFIRNNITLRVDGRVFELTDIAGDWYLADRTATLAEIEEHI